MKKTYYILFFTLTTLLSSCSIYENVYFAADGQVKYEMLIDASGMLAAMPDISNKIDKETTGNDSIISFSNILKEKYPDIDNLSQEKQDMINKIEPFYLKINNNQTESQLSILFAGEFENTQSMNEAFAALKILEEEQKAEKTKINSMPTGNMDKFILDSQFVWDGKQMARMAVEKTAQDDDDEEAAETDNENMMKMLLANGKYIIKYHFPAKVKSVSNKDALFSLDGKTVILDMPATALSNGSNIININIELE